MTAEDAPRRWSYGAVLFSVLLVLGAALAYIWPRGAPGMLGLGFLAALPLVRFDKDAAPGLLILLAFIALAGASVAWSPWASFFDPTDLERFTALKLLVQAVAFAGLAMAAARLEPRQAERAGLAMALGAVFLAMLLIVDGLARARLYIWFNTLIGETQRPDLAMRNIAQGAYVLAVLAWPAGAALRREGLAMPAALLALAVVAVMVLLGADAPAAALVAGAVAFALTRTFGRAGALATAAGAAAFWLTIPWLVLGADGAGAIGQLKQWLPASWDARLEIWSFAAHRIAEQPLLGWGIDASRHFGAAIPLHTHDAALQHWLELGAAGAVLAAAFLGWLYWRIAEGARTERGFAAVAAATLTSFLAVSCLSFSAWEEWWLAAGAFGLVGCALLRRFWLLEPSSTGHAFGPSI